MKRRPLNGRFGIAVPAAAAPFHAPGDGDRVTVEKVCQKCAVCFIRQAGPAPP